MEEEDQGEPKSPMRLPWSNSKGGLAESTINFEQEVASTALTFQNEDR